MHKKPKFNAWLVEEPESGECGICGGTVGETHGCPACAAQVQEFTEAVEFYRPHPLERRQQ